MTKKHLFFLFLSFIFIFSISYAATVEIPEAVDNLFISVTTGGNAPWFGQSDYS